MPLRFLTNVRRFVVASLFVLFFQGSGLGHAAAASDWSFEDNPQPDSSVLSRQDIDAFEAVVASPLPRPEKCIEAIALGYRLYGDFYPAFEDTGDPASRLAAWKRHALDDFPHRSLFRQCLIHEILDRLIDYREVYRDSDLTYCGRFSRPPRSAAEREFQGLIDALVRPVGRQADERLSVFGEMAQLAPLITLNADVRYFIVSALGRMPGHRSVEDVEGWSRDGLAGQLSKDRRSFVDLAVRNGDLDAVLATTPDCASGKPVDERSHARLVHAMLERMAPPVLSVSGLPGLDNDQDRLPWSFLDHMHPGDDALSESEREQRRLIEDRFYARFSRAGCVASLRRDFALYNERYPAFSRIGGQEQRFAAWKRHLVQSHYAGYGIGDCVTRLPALELHDGYDRYSVTGLHFCGRFSHSPVTALERRFESIISELVASAETGTLEGISALLLADELLVFVNLNGDVEYALRQSWRYNRHGGQEEWDTGPLSDQLTPARRAFVDRAVEDGDLARVLATTAACAEPSAL